MIDNVINIENSLTLRELGNIVRQIPIGDIIGLKVPSPKSQSFSRLYVGRFMSVSDGRAVNEPLATPVLEMRNVRGIRASSDIGIFGFEDIEKPLEVPFGLRDLATWEKYPLGSEVSNRQLFLDIDPILSYLETCGEPKSVDAVKYLDKIPFSHY